MISVDPGSAEVVFAQKLASCEARIRTKALNRLRKWIIIRQKSASPFEEHDLLKLWKGLYYCMWMQDKPLLQEELADNVTGLITCFNDNQQKLVFIDTFLKTMAREWVGVDRWRMDKYMMFMRRMLRTSLDWVKKNDFEESLITDLLSVWSNTVLSPDPLLCPEGLKYHFSSMILDELDNCGQVTPQHVLLFIAPYIQLLGKDIHEQYLETILQEIFGTILLEFSQSLIPEEEEEKMEESAGIKFDFAAIADNLFTVGKRKSVNSNRRQRIYDLVRKFRMASEGLDPDDDTVDPTDMPPRFIPLNDVKKATKTFIHISTPLPKKKKKHKPAKEIDVSKKTGVEKVLKAKKPKHKFKTTAKKGGKVRKRSK